MKIVNVQQIVERGWTSPKGRYGAAVRSVSLALGRIPDSMNLLERHPFDVEIIRVPPGKRPYPYHSHSAQWEYYHILAGSGSVRHANGVSEINVGDAFVFAPGEPHEIWNSGYVDLVVCVVADNPIGESYYYPDSAKCAAHAPERIMLRGEKADYYDGEE